MSSLPYPVRVAAGLVVTAVEEVQALPRTVAGLPISAVSRVLQLSMRAQQVVTEMAIKGDTALDGMRPVEEAPSWARFDDDDPSGRWRDAARREHPDPDDRAATAPVDDRPAASAGAADVSGAPERNGHAATGVPGEDGTTGGGTPDALPGYETLTIAALRAKLRSLSLEQVTELLAWESAHADRPPFVTMLSNRITTLTARG